MFTSSSLSALLPPPKNAPATSSNDQLQRQITAKNLSDEGTKSNIKPKDPGTTTAEALIARSRISFHEFMPLRQMTSNVSIPLPTDKEIEKTWLDTKNVLDGILSKNTQSIDFDPLRNRSEVKSIEIRNSHEPQGPKKSVKVIKQVSDPLQPKMFKIKKRVAPPVEEPFAPILHKSGSGGFTLTQEEKDDWNIPAAISNWKNPNGYAVDLQNRVASSSKVENTFSGRSSKSLELSNALDLAERKAREEVHLRAEIKKQEAERLTREREEKLRLMALRARERKDHGLAHFFSSADPQADQARQRQIIAEERRKQLELEARQSKWSTADRLRFLAHSQGRDVSEKVIIGAAKTTDSEDIVHDSRLYTKAARRNESQVYDSPLFMQESRSSIYRPKVASYAVERAGDTLRNLNQSTGSNETQNSNHRGPIAFTRAERSESARTENDEAEEREVKRPRNG
ncbi:LAMI_0F06172g1_1 [Lachancea mirantina]|uniref:Pre-mRNA-processing protein 45 n=1 Tax=Lachancea mirantina TaxID=1230905 RepID=A0A1G4JYP9_9SACH|nr:LAMI_0F06172g1_1 [Lachancea mirantina]